MGTASLPASGSPTAVSLKELWSLEKDGHSPSRNVQGTEFWAPGRCPALSREGTPQVWAEQKALPQRLWMEALLLF